MYNYIITMNSENSTLPINSIQQFIKDSRLISSFYSPYPGVFLIKSDYDIISVRNSFIGFFGSIPFLCILYESHFASGNMPQEVWNWINFNHVTGPKSIV